VVIFSTLAWGNRVLFWILESLSVVYSIFDVVDW
jgi:hypothetical protein